MRVTRKEWYRRVNETWPAEVPPMTGPEAVRAGKKLYRFVFGRKWTGSVRVTSGRRYSWIRRGEMLVNPGRGWKTLVHDLSHRFQRYLDGGAHGGDHARLERRMIKEVLRRGWLDGKLRSPERPEAPKVDIRAKRHQLVLANIKRWEQKLARAERALKKLRVKKRYYERIAK